MFCRRLLLFDVFCRIEGFDCFGDWGFFFC